MKRILIFFFLMACTIPVFTQASNVYKRGLSADESLRALSKPGPYTPGGIGFDNRYEGVKGSRRLLDTLLPSSLLLNSQQDYLTLPADIDLIGNSVIYTQPKSSNLLSISAELVSELIIKKEGSEMVFRTTSGKLFDKEIKPHRLYQVIHGDQYQFIKIPYKKLVEADYQGGYNPNRRYDEFQSQDKYFLIGHDSIFHQIQLNKKSLIKLYPEKKEIIDNYKGDGSSTGKEEMIISILSEF